MSILGEVEEGKILLGEIREKLNAYIDKINPDDNFLLLMDYIGLSQLRRTVRT